MKGIILAGGKGTRLYPATLGICKQLIPVYDKPMIYYPLSTLMLSKIREILLICMPQDLPNFQRIFGTGEHLGIHIEYALQPNANGLAEAFILGEKFIGSSKVSLVLGDNIFYGHGFKEILQRAQNFTEGATVFSYPVPNPERYGVINFDQSGNPESIEEKPQNPRSNLAVVGLYFYDNQVIEMAKNLAPSPRGELEIAEINDLYLRKKQLRVEQLSRGFAWLDMGNFQCMSDASIFIRTIEERQGLKIACVEEIAYKNGWITQQQLEEIAQKMLGSGYGDYLLRLIK